MDELSSQKRLTYYDRDMIIDQITTTRLLLGESDHGKPFTLLHIEESSTIETYTVCGMENRLVWGSVKKEYTE